MDKKSFIQFCKFAYNRGVKDGEKPNEILERYFSDLYDVNYRELPNDECTHRWTRMDKKGYVTCDDKCKRKLGLIG